MNLQKVRDLLRVAARSGLVLFILASGRQDAPAENPPAAVANRLNWWREARFGMFIHWGPVSLKGTEIGWSRGQEVPIPEYDTLYQRFNPTNVNADVWMHVARQAGMKYVVFTTKHHDGFCMWDTKQTDFNIMHSPFRRDVVKELAAAARREGLAFGTYHSVTDWHHPDFPLTSPGGQVRRANSNLERYERYLRAEVSELITNYGPLLVMWFDVPQEFDAKRGQGLIDYVRSLQPDLIVNDRSGAPGDYDTPEQRVGKFQFDRPWETCMTLCQQWAWKPDDKMKSLKECLQTLVLCAGGDGNLLFNVGPMPDGRIEQRQIDRLLEMGQWLEKNGTSIYGTRGGPWKPSKRLASTRKANTVYLHLLDSHDQTIILPNLPAKVLRSSVLTDGDVTVVQAGSEMRVTLPAAASQPIDTIIQLELDRPAMEIPPISLTALPKATASNVFQGMAEHSAGMAFDGDPETRWATDAGTREAWIAADLGHTATLRGVRIQEAYPGRVRKFEFQYREGQGWKTLFTGTSLGSNYSKAFPPVNTREVRLNILDASDGPTIWEITLDEGR